MMHPDKKSLGMKFFLSDEDEARTSETPAAVLFSGSAHYSLSHISIL